MCEFFLFSSSRFFLSERMRILYFSAKVVIFLESSKFSVFFIWFCYSRRGFSFLCTNKETKQRNSPAPVPKLKNHTIFLNEKNSLTLKQLFVLHGKYSIFLHASPLNAGRSLFEADTLLRSLMWMYS